MAILMRRALMTLAALMVVGCGLVRDPVAVDVPGAIQVHSLLLAGADSVAVLITRLDPAATSSEFQVPPHPVDDARVLLIRGGDTLQLMAGAADGPACAPAPGPSTEPDGLASGCYTGQVPGGVQSGATYDLRVELADGRAAEGTATIPESPQLITPEPGASMADPLQARWVMVPDRVLDLHIDPDPEGCNAYLRVDDEGGVASHFSFIDTDSAQVRLGFLDCTTDDRQLPGSLVLTVYDAPLTRYLTRGSGSLGSDAASVGLTDVYGIFAGAAQDRVAVSLPAEENP